jgi:hypothetical protein
MPTTRSQGKAKAPVKKKKLRTTRRSGKAPRSQTHKRKKEEDVAHDVDSKPDEVEGESKPPAKKAKIAEEGDEHHVYKSGSW